MYKGKTAPLFFLGILLAGSFCVSTLRAHAAETPTHMQTKPANGTIASNPFAQGNVGSSSFRIPATVTLDSGRIVAAADIRWNTTFDGGGLDTMVAWSDNNGATWSYTVANYLGDNGNTYNGASTCFIDPCLVTDGSTVWMMLDLTPYGVATNGNKQMAPSKDHTGFDAKGNLLLSSNNHVSYDYYLNMRDLTIYDSNDVAQTDYVVDAHFNIFGQGVNSNLFFSDSPFQVQRTSYLYFISSSNGGESWSAPQLINLKETRENGLYVAPGRGLYTSNGTIVIPCYGFQTDGTERTCFLYSTDKGNSWTRSADLCTGTGSTFNTSESAVVELPNGRLRFFFRDRRTNIQMRYADAVLSGGAYTWKAEVETPNYINVDCQMSAVTYSETVNGKQAILISCPTGPDRNGSHDNNGGASGARKNGSIFVGLIDHDDPDYAITWLQDMHVNSGNAQYMYSCLTEMQDGNIFLFYEDNQNGWGYGADKYFTMTTASFPISQVIQGATINNQKMDAALEAAATYEAKKAQYTTESYQKLETAVSNAKAGQAGVYDKVTIETLAAAVQTAIQNLELVKTEDPEPNKGSTETKPSANQGDAQSNTGNHQDNTGSANASEASAESQTSAPKENKTAASRKDTPAKTETPESKEQPGAEAEESAASEAPDRNEEPEDAAEEEKIIEEKSDKQDKTEKKGNVLVGILVAGGGCAAAGGGAFWLLGGKKHLLKWFLTRKK